MRESNLKNMKEVDLERLGKIVQLAKKGVGGEKTNALKIVKKICQKYNLDFDKVMGSLEESGKEYEICYKTGFERDFLGQILCKYTSDRSQCFRYNDFKKVVYFKATVEEYINVLNAFEVLLKLYKKERKKVIAALYYGFLEKHDLFYKGKIKNRPKETAEDYEIARIGSDLARNFEDSDIHKRLMSSKK